MNMNNKQINEVYRDFSGMAKSKSLSEIAKWLDGREEFMLINRDEISITFRFKERDLLVSITKGLLGTSSVILKRL